MTKRTPVIENKGPIEFFNQTKKSLRHVTQAFDSETDLTNSYYDEERESYVKVPVNQLINTFEKQMRPIIKQRVNENILNIDTTSRNEKREATRFITNGESETFRITDRKNIFNENMNYASEKLSTSIDLTPEKIHQEDIDDSFDTRDNQSNGGKRMSLSVPPSSDVINAKTFFVI